MKLKLGCNTFCHICILFDFVKVHVLVDLTSVFVDFSHAGLVLFHTWNAAQLGADGSNFSGSQIDIGVLTQTVGEVTGLSRDNRRTFTNLGLVAHAQ